MRSIAWRTVDVVRTHATSAFGVRKNAMFIAVRMDRSAACAPQGRRAASAVFTFSLCPAVPTLPLLDPLRAIFHGRPARAPACVVRAGAIHGFPVPRFDGRLLRLDARPRPARREGVRLAMA